MAVALPPGQGIPTAGPLAQVQVAKYADLLPLYRQEGIFVFARRRCDGGTAAMSPASLGGMRPQEPTKAGAPALSNAEVKPVIVTLSICIDDAPTYGSIDRSMRIVAIHAVPHCAGRASINRW